MLAKRRFYLDLKSRNAPATKQLVQDLIDLGGVSINNELASYKTLINRLKFGSTPTRLKNMI